MLDVSRPKLIPPGPRSPPSANNFRPRVKILGTSPPGSGIARERIKTLGTSPPTGGFTRDRTKNAGASPPGAGIAKERSLRSVVREQQQPVSHKQQVATRRKKAFNPFRQSDEDEVLAERSHNRRRWSHVFPAGEIEFKRHSGPNWNSLSSPAILPLSVDYFPSPQELRDESTFQFSPYTVTLGGLDKKHYSSHAELLMEMVRQRLTQDFQLVTAAAVEESENRAETQRQGKCEEYDLFVEDSLKVPYCLSVSVSQYAGRGTGKPSRRSGRNSFVPKLPTIKHDNSGTIKHYLSMGHRYVPFVTREIKSF